MIYKSQINSQSQSLHLHAAAEFVFTLFKCIHSIYIAQLHDIIALLIDIRRPLWPKTHLLIHLASFRDTALFTSIGTKPLSAYNFTHNQVQLPQFRTGFTRQIGR